MSEADIQVILHRLDELNARLCQIHDEVRKTNGRVTELEMREARLEGVEEGKAGPRMILMGVLTGAILAAVVWFVQAAI